MLLLSVFQSRILNSANDRGLASIFLFKGVDALPGTEFAPLILGSYGSFRQACHLRESSSLSAVALPGCSRLSNRYQI